jgi:hypothetical protein
VYSARAYCSDTNLYWYQMVDAKIFTANNNGGELFAITLEFFEPDINDVDNGDMILDITCALSESLLISPSLITNKFNSYCMHPSPYQP